MAVNHSILLPATDIQTRLAECAQANTDAGGKAKCMEELHVFLSCAKEVALAGFPMPAR
jgi:hypothetical protein